MGKKLNRANKTGVDIVVIIGGDELAEQTATVKFLREKRPQTTISQSQLVEFLET